MKLLPNWWQILCRAWSVRFIIVAGLFDAALAVLPMIPDLFHPPVWQLATAGALINFGALVSRLIAQKNLKETH